MNLLMTMGGRMKILLNRLFGSHILHSWEYHNPANRTCKVCDERQVQYCADYRDVFDRTKGWWEVEREGKV